MKIFILNLLLFFTTWFANAQSDCVRGNCKDTFSFQELEKGYQVGFYSNSKLEGFGVEVEKGKEYFGTYVNGMRNGLFYYKINGEASYGNFKNNLPVGLHVARIEAGYDYRNYDEKGVFINRSPIPSNVEQTGCIQGDCVNGYGVVNEDNNFFAGNYVNGKLEGVAMLYRTEEKLIIYCEMKDGKFNGVSIVVDFDGSISMYNMKPYKEGQAIYRSKDFKYRGFIFKEGKIESSY